MDVEEVLRRSETGQGLMLGYLLLPAGTAARTDTVGVPDRAVHTYVSGSDLVVQVYVASLGAWKSVTLS